MSEFGKPTPEQIQNKSESEELQKTPENPDSDSKSQELKEDAPEFFENPKEELVELTEATKKLFQELDNREYNNFSPILEEGDASRLWKAMTALSELSEQPQISYEKYYNSLGDLMVAMDEIGRSSSTSSSVRDSTESLEYLYKLFRELEDSSAGLAQKFGAESDRSSGQVANMLARLSGIAEDKKQLMGIRINMMDGYSNNSY